jgi:hypothetical protein
MSSGELVSTKLLPLIQSTGTLQKVTAAEVLTNISSFSILLASLGESVSSAHVYRQADQISEAEFKEWDTLAYKLENGVKKLIESLQHKREQGEWDDSFIVKESNAAYDETDME